MIVESSFAFSLVQLYSTLRLAREIRAIFSTNKKQNQNHDLLARFFPRFTPIAWSTTLLTSVCYNWPE